MFCLSIFLQYVLVLSFSFLILYSFLLFNSFYSHLFWIFFICLLFSFLLSFFFSFLFVQKIFFRHALTQVNAYLRQIWHQLQFILPDVKQLERHRTYSHRNTPYCSNLKCVCVCIVVKNVHAKEVPCPRTSCASLLDL